ncbi:MAG: type IV pilus modification protein PilV [Gammaproteobacteria bacterium]|uniref:Type IV pilus modification protein PilV n=1 Tax=Vreelandella titanicae TaxID=664683 RepID=A0A558JD89_9GAMM|nr:type IV pilus modification protein PilV [Halomonas titanicae]MBR9902569.1 type IV pilus modification protein PilV [Gammaproteobacteria bacterium]TVU91606.1 type IV pilus modification protein PilV [Halomonas titanicae]
MLAGKQAKQRGFSLIEALIALVVLSIGLIGVAAMQLKALQSANTGYLRSVASVAAVDAQERLWAELVKDGVDSCADIAIEIAWKAQWFTNSDSNPLRNVNAQESKIESNGCEFTIEIDLGSRAGETESDVFTYRLRLPELEGG